MNSVKSVVEYYNAKKITPGVYKNAFGHLIINPETVPAGDLCSARRFGGVSKTALQVLRHAPTKTLAPGYLEVIPGYHSGRGSFGVANVEAMVGKNGLDYTSLHHATELRCRLSNEVLQLLGFEMLVVMHDPVLVGTDHCVLVVRLPSLGGPVYQEGLGIDTVTRQEYWQDLRFIPSVPLRKIGFLLWRNHQW